MKPLITAAILILTTAAYAETSTKRINVNDRDRTYLLHLPEGHDPHRGTKYPVVLVFHGGGGNAGRMVAMSGMNDTADREGFITVYPNGTGRLNRRLTFNGGECCGYAANNNIDDVAFVAAILDELEAEHAADPARVYATGLSNGGIVSHHLAAHLAERITAIAPVAGTLGAQAVNPTRPVPVMHIHGTDDAFLPVQGGYGKNRRTRFRSVDHTLRAWVHANHAEPTPTIVALPDTADDGCTVERITYPAKDTNSAEVVYIRINNGGHTWPGSTDSPNMLGAVCHDINANDLMWAFFKQHVIE